jgi:hypothetical protein
MKKRKQLIVLLLIIFVSFGSSQIQLQQRFDEVHNTFGFSKRFDSLFFHASTIAFSAYPELKNIEIVYKEGQLKTIMAARPILLSIFRQKSKRKYKILLSNNSINNCEQLFCQIPAPALTGILGHEYAHLLTYNNKSSVQLILYAFKYLFNKKDIERETDLITIKHGFGKELIDYNIYILNSDLVSKRYLKKRHNNYLSINEIHESIDQ